MRNLILNNLAAKIISLLIASVLWFAVKKNVEATSSSPKTPPSRRAARPASAVNSKAEKAEKTQSTQSIHGNKNR